MRTVSVKVVSNARKSEILEKDGKFIVRVRAPASDNKANNELIRILAEYFSVQKNDVRIIRGNKTRNKTVQINQ